MTKEKMKKSAGTSPLTAIKRSILGEIFQKKNFGNFLCTTQKSAQVHIVTAIALASRGVLPARNAEIQGISNALDKIW